MEQSESEFMGSLYDERHPWRGPKSPAQLPSLVADAAEQDFKTLPNWQLDQLEDELRAQLFWYSIDHTDRTMLPTLEKLLRQAIADGKCDENAPRIIEYERRKAEAQRENEEAWQRCTTPSERARQDIDRFMEFYFLTKGKPDRTKSAAPLAIYGYVGRHDIYNRAERVPGLATCSGGDGAQRTVCIGWDHGAVSRLAGAISVKSGDEKAKKLKDEWDEHMEEHRAFIESHKKEMNAKKRLGTLTNHERLDKCNGSYVIRCKQLSDDWDNCESLTMDIAAGPEAGILQAAVRFGMIEGTMLMASTEDDLDSYLGTTCVYADSDSDDSEEAEEPDDSNLLPTSSSKKRKATANHDISETSRHRPKKQATSSATTSNRIFLRFRGRETTQGQIFYEVHKGYMDFTDSDFVAFEGFSAMPYLGSKVPFEGFKISSSAALEAEPWSSFSEVEWGMRALSW